ncbi:DsbA family oxidoreductase [Melghirimyces algeriensis]|uniref:Predicted dithiol-disulfide isomerase, DsbA family n=1 Tax=Melghirimyces algeriensis TaxID=910412 RepID=A0A521DI52_9BACL|nr:DsbA family protein [Melghirimyces algeriensis]SMO71262.1 Predicted dithiol-disulfide isomerase, DsbA family [Melghirimyces algeriensis]
MSVNVKVYSDYICPFCFLAKASFEKAIQGKDVEVEWMPFELRPSPSPKLDPVNDPSKRMGWDQFIKPTAKKWGVHMKLPYVSPHPYTNLAFEGFHFSKEHGKGKEYNDRVFTAFFQEEQDIGDIDVLTNIAGEVGLNQGDFREALMTRKYKEIQQQSLKHANEEAQITAVPTFIIGDERIQGVVNKETFERILDQELKKNRNSVANGCNAM